MNEIANLKMMFLVLQLYVYVLTHFDYCRVFVDYKVLILCNVKSINFKYLSCLPLCFVIFLCYER